MAGALDLTTVLGGALGIVCWLVIARACRRGRSWTRVAATVLLALNTASLVTVLLATHNDDGIKTTSLLVWIIGLAATIPLWGRAGQQLLPRLAPPLERAFGASCCYLHTTRTAHGHARCPKPASDRFRFLP